MTITRETFHQIASVVDHGLIAVSDFKEGESPTILFNEKLEALLGWKDGELEGKSFNDSLLPKSFNTSAGYSQDFHAFHNGLMQKIKLSRNASVARDMLAARGVKALAKNGALITVIAKISYQGDDANRADYTGIYFAIVADPNSGAAAARLDDANTIVSTMISPSLLNVRRAAKTAVKNARALLLKKIAASGGIIGFIVWFLTQMTPMGVALKGFIAAWRWDEVNKGFETKNIGIYQTIRDVDQIDRMKSVRDYLNTVDRRVIGVGFYQLDTVDPFSKGRLIYRGDSGAANGEELFFQDQVLSTDQFLKLNQHECFYVSRLGIFYDRKGQPSFSGIICPTLFIKQTKDVNTIVLGNAIAVALSTEAGCESDCKQSKISLDDIEPLATLLWQRGPSVDDIFNPD